MMIEKPLERLNYFNGQRLEATDLKLEQEYHIRVRRWLNRSLYSPGIASGLEVREEPGTRKVVIGPGLALDAEGHEIVLLEEAHEVVPGRGHRRPGPGSDAVVEGLYLTIRYDEQVVAEERGVCGARPCGDAASSRPASGGPSRISARPLFAWRAFLPPESSGEVALAQVELDDTCSKVHQIDTGVRRYVGASSAAKVRQYALDGEKAIDSRNSGRIYFHVRGRQPNAVTLYLRSAKFSTLQYTEMGQHNHPAHINGDQAVSTESATYVDAHMHNDPNDLMTQLVAANEVVPGAFVGHTHTLKASATTANGYRDDQLGFALGPSFNAVAIAFTKRDNVDLSRFGLTVNRTPHEHAVLGPIGSLTERPWAEATLHKHPVNISASLDDAGVTPPAGAAQDYKARSGAPLTYVDNLQVFIGSNANNMVNHTEDIKLQLQASRPQQENWSKLGGGPIDPTHTLIEKGTGAIRLDFLPGVAFTEGEYIIDLRVTQGGGRVFYNLYVE